MFCFFAKTFQHCCQKFFYVSEGSLRNKTLRKKLTTSYHSHFEQEVSGVLPKSFSLALQNCILRVQVHFLTERKRFFQNRQFSYQSRSLKLDYFVRISAKKPGTVLKTVFCISREALFEEM